MAASKSRVKIIVTRPAIDAAGFAALAMEAGCEPIVSPVMEIRQRPQAINFDDIGALAFTSANGVRALAALSPTAPVPAPVFAVGPITAAAARAAGHTDIHVAGGDVSSLAALIKKNWRGARAVLHAAGSARAGDLVKMLASANITARRATLYEAIPLPQMSPAASAFLATSNDAGWVALFSPRSATLFLEQVKRAALTEAMTHHHAACLSAGVREAAMKIGWASARAPETPTGAALLAMIAGKN